MSHKEVSLVSHSRGAEERGSHICVGRYIKKQKDKRKRSHNGKAWLITFTVERCLSLLDTVRVGNAVVYSRQGMACPSPSPWFPTKMNTARQGMAFTFAMFNVMYMQTSCTLPVAVGCPASTTQLSCEEVSDRMRQRL